MENFKFKSILKIPPQKLLPDSSKEVACILLVFLFAVSLFTLSAFSEVVANYQDDFQTETPKTGWFYGWNMPPGWPSDPSYSQNSLLDAFGNYTALQYATNSRYTPDGDTNYSNNPPASILRVYPTGGGPGNGSGDISGNLDRFVVVQYTVTANGYYKLTDAWIKRDSASGGGCQVIVMDADGDVVYDELALSDNTLYFDCYVGFVAAGQKITIAVGPNGYVNSDSFTWDFTIETYTPLFTTSYGAATNAGSTLPEGWSFYWNAPDGWDIGEEGDLSTGPITDTSSWKSLVWTGTKWTADGDEINNNYPSGFLRIEPEGGIPGRTGTSLDLDRYAISTFKVPISGSYQIGMAWIHDFQTPGNGVLVKIFVNNQVIKTVTAPTTEVTRFETRLENLDINDTISVAVGANGNHSYDVYDLNYTIAKVLPDLYGINQFPVSSYGAVGDGVTDDKKAFADAIAAAKAQGEGTVVLDGTKTYRIIGDPNNIQAALDLDDASNIRIKGNGATLKLHPPHRLTDILDCENIEIRDLKVDYSPLPYFQGTISSVNVSNKTIDINVPTRYPVPDIAGSWPEFSRLFDPDGSSRSGTGKHLYVDSVSALDGTGRYLRVQARSDMGDEVQYANDYCTELIMPNRLYGQRGNFSIRIRRSSCIYLRNVELRCVPHFVNQCQDNYGPITLSNVDVLMPDPDTELFVSWRDGFHLKENRFGVLIDTGDWDGSSMYDDLFNMSSHMAVVQSIDGDTYSLYREGGDYHTWKIGDWVSVWNSGQTTKRGMARIEAPNSISAVYMDITLDRTISGVVTGDLFINEEHLNRDTLVRYCETKNIGAAGSSARLRTPAKFYDNDFIDSYWWLYTESSREGPRPRDIVFEDCELEGTSQWGLAVLSAANSVTFDGCTFDGNNTIVCKNGIYDKVKLNDVHWINQVSPKKSLHLETNTGPVYLYGGSTVNGSGNLEPWVQVDSGATIYYSAP